MKLATFTKNDTTRVGIVVNDEIIDTQSITTRPMSMSEFLHKDLANSDEIKNLVNGTQGRIPLAEVKLEAPVSRPPKFLAVGLNYLDHIAETGANEPEYPTIFNKQSTCVIGPTR